MSISDYAKYRAVNGELVDGTLTEARLKELGTQLQEVGALDWKAGIHYGAGRSGIPFAKAEQIIMEIEHER